MGFVVEDGSGVAGANSLCHPGFAAAYHADRGNLSPSTVLSLQATFAPGGSIELPAGQGANVPALSIVEVLGAAQAGNVGFAYVDAVAGDVLTVSWLDGLVAEGPVAVTLTVHEKSGWWAARRRLEASLVNATALVASRAWYGSPVKEVQGTPFPRRLLAVRRGSPYYAAGTILPEDEVPVAVREAVAEVSLEDLSEPVGEVIRPRAQLVSKTTGPLSKTFANPKGVRRYPVAERKLRGLYAPRTPFRSLGTGV